MYYNINYREWIFLTLLAALYKAGRQTEMDAAEFIGCPAPAAR